MLLSFRILFLEAFRVWSRDFFKWRSFNWNLFEKYKYIVYIYVYVRDYKIIINIVLI